MKGFNYSISGPRTSIAFLNISTVNILSLFNLSLFLNVTAEPSPVVNDVDMSMLISTSKMFGKPQLVLQAYSGTQYYFLVNSTMSVQFKAFTAKAQDGGPCEA